MQKKKLLSSPMKEFFCYKMMPFGLKNAGATYQKLVSDIFNNLVGTTVEIYVDVMVVKSQSLEDHSGNIQMVFDVLNKAGMKLNLEKYIFGIKVGKFFRVYSFRKRHRSKLEKKLKLSKT